MVTSIGVLNIFFAVILICILGSFTAARVEHTLYLCIYLFT